MACSSGEGRSEYALGSFLVSYSNALFSEVASDGHGSALGPLCIVCEMTLTFVYLFLDLYVGGAWWANTELFGEHQRGRKLGLSGNE